MLLVVYPARSQCQTVSLGLITSLTGKRSNSSLNFRGANCDVVSATKGATMNAMLNVRVPNEGPQLI